MLQVIARNGNPHCLQAMNFDDSLRGVVSEPGSQRPDSGPYICFVAVLDYWRLDPANCARAGVTHFSSSLEPELVSDVVSGRAFLVFDLSNEGPEFNITLFDFIHQYIDMQQIPASRVIWLAQNRNISQAYRAAYQGKREFLLRFEYYDYYIKLMAHWFASESWRSQVFGDLDSYTAALTDPSRKKHFALCLNATPRTHRIWTVAALHHYKILERCLVSFTGLNYAKGLPLDPNHIIAGLGELMLLSASCSEVAKMPPMKIDNFGDVGNQLVDKIATENYISTFFSIVTETDFTDGEIDRITEKSVKTFCLGHPALIIGNPGALAFIRHLGFQDFSPEIHAGYDAVRVPSVRFFAAFSEILAQIVALQANPAEWLGRMNEISRFNITHATGGLLRVYQEKYEQPLVRKLSELADDYTKDPMRVIDHPSV